MATGTLYNITLFAKASFEPVHITLATVIKSTPDGNYLLLADAIGTIKVGVIEV
jgi:hypothetical protein